MKFVVFFSHSGSLGICTRRTFPPKPRPQGELLPAGLRVGIFFVKMYCLSAPRVLRQTSPADDCWGNISLLPESQAGAYGFLTEATLYKKQYDEKNNQNKLNCSFPLHDNDELPWQFCVTCMSAAIISGVRLFSKPFPYRNIYM